MNTKTLRMKNSKRGVTPVIATIILIAGTLVLALVVGAYTFGLFGANVKTIQLTSGLLNSGSAAVVSVGAGVCSGANFALTFNNPGGATFIQSISLSAGGVSAIGTGFWFTSGSGGTGSCTAATYTSGAADTFNIANGAGQQADPFVGNALTSGTTYSYVITFGNGQSISGALIAQ